MTTPSSPDRYSLSFTTGGLLAHECDVASGLYLSGLSWPQVRAKLIEDNLLQSRTISTRVRTAREVIQRLGVLNNVELELLQDASPSERGYLLWAAACRRYTFIGDFAEEVVRERFLLMVPTLEYEHFDSFVNGKRLWHAELNELKTSTIQKLRQTVYRMLNEAGLRKSGGEIVSAVLSTRIAATLDCNVPSDLRFFPYSPFTTEVHS